MSGFWKKRVGHLLRWIIIEILLILLNMDDIADYSEFIDQSKILRMETRIAAQNHFLCGNYLSTCTLPPHYDLYLYLD